MKNCCWLFSLLSIFMLSTLTMYAQNGSKKEISGIVLDENESPIIGATAKIKGSTTGSITDLEGRFTLPASSDDVLQVSYLGYETFEQIVGNKTIFEIKLTEDAKVLDEVIVMGYGVVNKKSVTGSVAQVKAEDLNKVNAVSVDNMLQGRAAGLTISQFTAQPGGDVNISIRGGGTPLYVIDGVAMFGASENMSNVDAGRLGPSGENFRDAAKHSPLSTINPNDIETIDILKDAAATAIYGSAAANGVVLITTKKGKAGKISVSYSGSVSVQEIYTKLEMLNGSDFRKYQNLATQEKWLADKNYYPYGATPAPVPGSSGYDGPTLYYTDQDILDAPSYDHFDAITRTGMITDHNISITGGTESTKMFASFGYYDQQSVIKSSDFKRFSGRINLEQTLSKWLKLSVNTTYTVTQANNAQVTVNTDSRASRDNPNEAKMTGAAMLFPSDAPLEEGGILTKNIHDPQLPNPLAYMAVKDIGTSDRLFFAPNIEATITSYLKANLVGGIDRSSADRDMWATSRAKLPMQKEENYGGFSKSYANNYSIEGYLTFNKHFGADHHLSAVAGVGGYKQDFKSYSITVFNLPTEAVENNNLGLAEQHDLDITNSRKAEFTKLSQFGRLSYTFKGRYILGVTVRRDGSDRFPPSKKWGFFPGVSLGWTMSEESFMSSLAWIDNLKLRAGYGTTGNDNVVRDGYYYLDQYVGGSLYGMVYSFGGQPKKGMSYYVGRNENFVWQTDETINAGADFSFFKGRLSGSLDVFQRTTKDLLGYTHPPITSPVAQLATNIGSQHFRGIELGINVDIIRKNGFSWDAYLNLSHLKRTWGDRDPNETLEKWVGAHDEVNAVYGWKTDGIFQSREEVQNYKNEDGELYQPTSHPGNLKYVDINKDGKLDGDDVVKLGCTDPKLNFGFGTTVRYKGFDLTIGTYGAIGMLTKDSWAYTNLEYMTKVNQSIYVKEAWSTFNPTGTRVGIKPDAGISKPADDDYTMQKTWYLRLKNITLGYTIPKNWLVKNNLLQDARIFVDAQNIGLLTNYEGFDPEMELNNSSPYPIPYSISMGVNIKF